MPRCPDKCAQPSYLIMNRFSYHAKLNVRMLDRLSPDAKNASSALTCLIVLMHGVNPGTNALCDSSELSDLYVLSSRPAMNPDNVTSNGRSFATAPVNGAQAISALVMSILIITSALVVSGCTRNQNATPPPAADSVEQLHVGTKPSPTVVASFEGLGASFEGPQTPRNSSLTSPGAAASDSDPTVEDPADFKLTFRNPSDNSLAVGPNHIIQTVNSRTAIFTKAGDQFDTTGDVLYGPVENSNFFHGFGGACEAINNGDTVVRFDQLAGRWLVSNKGLPSYSRRPRAPNPESVVSGNSRRRSGFGCRGVVGECGRSRLDAVETDDGLIVWLVDRLAGFDAGHW